MSGGMGASHPHHPVARLARASKADGTEKFPSTGSRFAREGPGPDVPECSWAEAVAIVSHSGHVPCSDHGPRSNPSQRERVRGSCCGGEERVAGTQLSEERDAQSPLQTPVLNEVLETFLEYLLRMPVLSPPHVIVSPQH